MIVYAHGLEGRPDGRKARAMMGAGLEVVAPEGRGLPLAERIVGIRKCIDAHPGCVLVGSSYGGLAATWIAQHHGSQLSGLLLCAPALIRSEEPVTDSDALMIPSTIPTWILHGVHDAVVGIDASRRLASRCPHVVLEERDDDHMLRGSLDRLVEVATLLVARSATEPG